MRLTPINAPQISTHPTCTSRHACNCYKTGKHLLVHPTRATLQYHRTFTHKLISLLLYTGLLLLSGVLLNPSNLLKDLRLLHWVPQGGIVPSRRFATQVCLHSS